MKSKRPTAVIALCGKGGVGKTSISAAITRILVKNKNNRILAIDADPAVGLATALGFTARKTVDDIRSSFISRIKEGKTGDKQEINALLDYEVFGAIEERDNLAFMAIGRPEKDGCYCQVNSMLKDVIETIAKNFDFVVIDGEAGIEQVNRRVMRSVTHLLLVSDASAKGINVAGTIKEVAGGAVKYEFTGLIINKIRDEKEIEKLSFPPGLAFLGWVPEDDGIRDADIKGKSVFDIPVSKAHGAVHEVLNKLEFCHELPGRGA